VLKKGSDSIVVLERSNKMKVGDLYGFVLVIVLVGILLGVGILVLANFASSSAVTGTAETAINSTIDALSPISATWLPLIVTVGVLAIILGLVLTAFSLGGRR